MAKVGFGSLKITKVDDRVNTFTFNEKEIEVKRYLPFSDKLTLIGNAINLAADGNRFANPMKIDMYLDLEIMFAYTNITFTDKQKEDLVKLYDMLDSVGFFEAMYEAIPEDEVHVLQYNTFRLAENMYSQMNSAYGIMENIATDYADIGEKIEEYEEKIGNPKNLTLLKDVITKLG